MTKGMTKGKTKGAAKAAAPLFRFVLLFAGLLLF